MFYFLVVSGDQIPNLTYIIHCLYQLSQTHVRKTYVLKEIYNVLKFEKNIYCLKMN